MGLLFIFTIVGIFIALIVCLPNSPKEEKISINTFDKSAYKEETPKEIERNLYLRHLDVEKKELYNVVNTIVGAPEQINDARINYCNSKIDEYFNYVSNGSLNVDGIDFISSVDLKQYLLNKINSAKNDFYSNPEIALANLYSKLEEFFFKTDEYCLASSLPQSIKTYIKIIEEYHPEISFEFYGIEANNGTQFLKRLEDFLELRKRIYQNSLSIGSEDKSNNISEPKRSVIKIKRKKPVENGINLPMRNNDYTVSSNETNSTTMNTNAKKTGINTEILKLQIGFALFVIISIIIIGAIETNNSKSSSISSSKSSISSSSMVSSSAYVYSYDSFDPKKVYLNDTPDSTCFSEIGYNESNEVLVVRFRDSGVRYAYYGFTFSDWNSFRAASSLGKYYNSYIKGYFEYERLD